MFWRLIFALAVIPLSVVWIITAVPLLVAEWVWYGGEMESLPAHWITWLSDWGSWCGREK